MWHGGRTSHHLSREQHSDWLYYQHRGIKRPRNNLLEMLIKQLCVSVFSNDFCVQRGQQVHYWEGQVWHGQLTICLLPRKRRGKRAQGYNDQLHTMSTLILATCLRWCIFRTKCDHQNPRDRYAYSQRNIRLRVRPQAQGNHSRRLDIGIRTVWCQVHRLLDQTELRKSFRFC